MMQSIQRAQKLVSHLGPHTLGVPSPLPCSSSLPCSSTPQPLRVAITGAAGQIGYALLPLVAMGQMFGAGQPIILHLLEVEPAMKALNGVIMELIDGAFPLVLNVVATSDPVVAFKDVDYCILVGAFPRKQGMERGDLLGKNAAIFETQGKAIEQYASRKAKVLVVGNPANTNCLIARHFAPSIPDENWSALTRLDHHRAAAQIAQKLNIPVRQVKNVTIWGNHSATQFPDASHAVVKNADGSSKRVNELLSNSYLQGPFVPTVQKRGAEVIAARGVSSAMSAAVAITAHIRDWHLGTAPGEWVSMGVMSDGSYGAPKGVIYSFPVTISNGKWSIVKGLTIDDFGVRAMKLTGEELLQEKELAFGKLNIKV